MCTLREQHLDRGNSQSRGPEVKNGQCGWSRRMEGEKSGKSMQKGGGWRVQME